MNQVYNIGGIEQKHDKNGNLIQDGSMNFVFNALGQMTEAKSGGMTVGKYEYDPLGRRKAKTAGGLKTEYLWSGNQVMAEYRGGTLLRRYIYGAGIDNPIALISGNGTKTYIHKDALGSVVALSNNAGLVTDKFSYSPFGKSADESGSPYKFAARRIDSETGLYYNRNRYYNPSTGRFISPDPIGYGDGMNMYAYVGNDPMNASDPMGLTKTCTGSRIRRSDGFNCSRGTSWVTCSGNCVAFNGYTVLKLRFKVGGKLITKFPKKNSMKYDKKTGFIKISFSGSETFDDMVKRYFEENPLNFQNTRVDHSQRCSTYVSETCTLYSKNDLLLTVKPTAGYAPMISAFLVYATIFELNSYGGIIPLWCSSNGCDNHLTFSSQLYQSRIYRETIYLPKYCRENGCAILFRMMQKTTAGNQPYANIFINIKP